MAKYRKPRKGDKVIVHSPGNEFDGEEGIVTGAGDHLTGTWYVMFRMIGFPTHDYMPEELEIIE